MAITDSFCKNGNNFGIGIIKRTCYKIKLFSLLYIFVISFNINNLFRSRVRFENFPKEKCMLSTSTASSRNRSSGNFTNVSNKNKFKQRPLTLQVSPRRFLHNHSGICLQSHRLSHHFHSADFPGETSFSFHFQNHNRAFKTSD